MNITIALPGAALGALVLVAPTKTASFEFSSNFQDKTILTEPIEGELDPDGNRISVASVTSSAIAKRQAVERDIA